MSLLLCRHESVQHPYYVEFLGIHIYSSQELCYVIYKYPLLVLEGFVDEILLTFLREELNQGFLALKLERWLKSGENQDETLVMILQECDYYASGEINRFKQHLGSIRKMPKAEYYKQKADALFHLRHYGKASALYQELLERQDDPYGDDMFIGRVWNNLGACYVRMFRLESGFDAYEKAHLKTGEQEILESLYKLTRISNKLTLSDRCNSLITEEMKQSWEERMEAAKQKAAVSEPVLQLEELFSKDSIKRQAGVAALVGTWKREYRTMV